MKDWLLAFLPVLALACTVVAVVNRTNEVIAVPAAAAAVAVAGSALGLGAQGRWVALSPARVPAPPEGWGIRAWFLSGRLGREETILLLDRLDRSGPHPELPTRSEGEMARLFALPHDEFRRYLVRRMDELEAGT